MIRRTYLQRPLGWLAVFLALALGGLFCWWRLPVSLLPSLPQPRLTVLTQYENAPPQEVEALVTRRLEEVLGTVSGLERLESVSSEGLSRLSLIFKWGVDLSPAAAQVREKLDAVADQLPRQAEAPVVLRYDASQSPVLTLALTGGKDARLLRIAADELVKRRLETVPGVAAVRLAGGLRPEVQVLVDRGRLQAHGLDLAQVRTQVEAANVNAPAGEVRLGRMELMVRTVGRFNSLLDITQVPLPVQGTAGALTLDQVATVRDAFMDPAGFCRVGGKEAVLLAVLGEPGSNAVEASRLVRARLSAVAALLPREMSLEVVDDQAPFIQESLSHLGSMVLWGGLLSLGVLAAFLRRPGASLLVVLAIPLSLLTTLGLMYGGGVGLNLMSIGGLALGVGMLVDGAIVVLEAFHRQRAHGLAPLEASLNALDEVRAGLISGTLTTAVVLVPFVFLTGLAQRLFSDFAFTLVAALIISLGVAVLLLPALLAWRTGGRMLGNKDSSGDALAQGYGHLLLKTLEHKGVILVLSGFVLVSSVGTLWGLGASLLPELGRDRLLVRITLAPEAGLGQVTQAVDQVEKKLGALKETRTMVTRAGVEPQQDGIPSLGPGRSNQAMITLYLKDGAEPGAVLSRLMDSLPKELASTSGPRVEVLRASLLTAPGRRGMVPPQLLVLTGPDLAGLRRLEKGVRGRLKKLAHLTGVESQGAELTRQLKVEVDREAAASRGISVSRVAQAVRLAVQGEEAGKLIRGDRETPIRVRLRPSDRRTPTDLYLLPLKTPGGGGILLGQAAQLLYTRGPEEILRYERRRAVVIRGQVSGLPFSLGQDAALRAARQEETPSGYEILPGAQRLELTRSLSGLAGALGLAMVLFYVILVVQFESLRWPLVIMLGLPPVALGPALALSTFGLPISSLVLLGGVVLMGIAVNNSILLVDRVNQLRAAGLSPRAAVLEAAKVRLRPILMSTFTTVMGALPLCLGWQGGAALARPMALTVASGLLTALFTSLILVPVLYLLLSGPTTEPGT